MAQRGLHAIQPKTFVPKTSDGRADKPSPNLLSGQPLPATPDHAWAGDMTFIPTSAGWLYLAVVIDLCSRRIVGWSLADHMRSDLVLAALNQALLTRPARHAIFHRDRSSQYGRTGFRKALAKAGLRQRVRHWKTLASRLWPRPTEQPVWQLDFWDTQLRRVEHYVEKWEYVRQNPVRAGLVEAPESWAHQGELNELRW